MNHVQVNIFDTQSAQASFSCPENIVILQMIGPDLRCKENFVSNAFDSLSHDSFSSIDFRGVDVCRAERYAEPQGLDTSRCSSRFPDQSPISLPRYFPTVFDSYSTLLFRENGSSHIFLSNEYYHLIFD